MSWTPEQRATYLKNALQKAGLSMELAEKIKGEDEASVLGEINAMLIADIDRRTNKAVETGTANLKKDLDSTKAELEALKKGTPSQKTQTGNGNGDPQGGGTEGQPDLIKAMTDLMKPVIDRLDVIEKGKEEDKKSVDIKKALKEAGLSEELEQFVAPTVTEKVTVVDAVGNFKKALTDMKADELNALLSGSRIPGQSGDTKTIGEDTAKEYAKSLNTNAGAAGTGFAAVDLLAATHNAPSNTGVGKQ